MQLNLKYVKRSFPFAIALLLVSFTTLHFEDKNNLPTYNAGHSLHANSGTLKLRNYKVEPLESKLVWTAKKVLGSHTGEINLSQGNLSFEDNQLRTGNFEIDLRTITSTDLTDKESNGKLINHLKGDDFFAVEKFPKAVLTITSASQKAAGVYDVSGQLTIKNITQEVHFPATVTLQDNSLTASAQITIDRTKYNIRYRSKAFFDDLGDKAIYDEFDVDVHLIAKSAE